jgi:hypothetical protein
MITSHLIPTSKRSHRSSGLPVVTMRHVDHLCFRRGQSLWLLKSTLAKLKLRLPTRVSCKATDLTFTTQGVRAGGLASAQ